mmetsp:Transcript_82465/g.209663  ORF Transcript_82465/g.209663 Transcript_82465/m.209663 type:complete len:205 (-) Transcript_82465:797-1411(-)
MSEGWVTSTEPPTKMMISWTGSPRRKSTWPLMSSLISTAVCNTATQSPSGSSSRISRRSSCDHKPAKSLPPSWSIPTIVPQESMWGRLLVRDSSITPLDVNLSNSRSSQYSKALSKLWISRAWMPLLSAAFRSARSSRRTKPQRTSSHCWLKAFISSMRSISAYTPLASIAGTRDKSRTTVQASSSSMHFLASSTAPHTEPKKR